VKLSGTLVRKTFPGPPNYESNRRGDQREVYWLLVLSRPTCVDQSKTDPDIDIANKDIQSVQLVFLDPGYYKRDKNLAGKRVVATGTLFGAISGHHHTPVLLTVASLKKAE
jgi:Domain of unknown function (DUF4431)